MQNYVSCHGQMADFEERLERACLEGKFPHSLEPRYVPVAYCIHNGITRMADMVNVCHMQQQSIGKILKIMERDGLVKRIPHKEDKRSSLFTFTALGKKAVQIFVSIDRV